MEETEDRKSQAKWYILHTYSGYEAMVKGSLEKLIDLTDGFFALGGSNIGYNIVSVETLRDAKLHPEKHTDLMVKVAGYAAYFIELGDGCQDDIIHRTEHHI